MQIFEYLRVISIGLMLCFGMSNTALSENNVQLLVIEEPGCVYCARFNREIAQAYPKTSEGAIAPLHRIQLHDDWPTEWQGLTKPKYTPTFILVRNGNEVDRLLGYPGDDHFWFLLGEMLNKL